MDIQNEPITTLEVSLDLNQWTKIFLLSHQIWLDVCYTDHDIRGFIKSLNDNIKTTHGRFERMGYWEY